QRMMAQLSHFHRMTCRIGIDQSHGIGGALTLIRLFPADEVKAPLRDWLRAEGLPAAIARPGLLGGALLENDLAIANAPATNQGMDDFPLAERQEWAILIDGAEWEPTRAAAIEVLGEGPLAEHGIDGDVHIASYQFLFGVSR
ncbi:MAG: hypothetical protein QF491_10560, partial [Alphaproteobacteria bacterium]|nr:hypothetical protein [Alphaproteobacteria bacterium]